MIHRVIQTVARYGMLRANDRVLVGVSGGPDSMALLHILSALAPEFGLKVAVAHINHGLRPADADKDESFVKQSAEKLSIPFFRHQAEPIIQNGSIEEQAREVRYAFFQNVMKHNDYSKVALGHQKNDNAEAVLLHLLRGSGRRGLGGIPPVREGWVIRPLIQLDRADILAFLNDHNIPYVLDATNADPVFERNRIRHQLIPLLEKDYNANIVETLHRTADLCREEENWFKVHLGPLLDKVVSRLNPTFLELDTTVLQSEPLAVQRRLIRDALNRWHGHIRRMGAVHIDAIIKLITTKAIGKKINLPNDITAVRDTGGLYFSQSDGLESIVAEETPGYCYTVEEEGPWPQTIEIPEANHRLIFSIHDRSQIRELALNDENWAWFDLDQLDFPLIVRNFKPGDRINPYGMQGSQKIKKLYIDRKIPLAHRKAIPLLESRGTILWVVGIRRGNKAAVTENTRSVLSVKVDRSD